MFLLDNGVPLFSPTAPFYESQLSLDLKVNVYKDGEWGSYRQFPFVESIAPGPINLEEPMTQLANLR